MIQISRLSVHLADVGFQNYSLRLHVILCQVSLLLYKKRCNSPFVVQTHTNQWSEAEWELSALTYSHFRDDLQAFRKQIYVCS